MTRRPARKRSARKAQARRRPAGRAVKRTAAKVAAAKHPVRKPPARKPPRVAAKADALDDFIAAGAKALGLTIDKAWMPAVRTNLEVTLRLGAMVAAFPLPDDAEPAPVFVA